MELNPAQQLMAKRYHCSESVLMAVCQKLGVESPLIPRIATPFAGGMVGTGEVCGAVTGALMAIGATHGRDEIGQREGEAHRLGQEVMRAFREEMGTLLCRELTGHDLSTPEGLAAFRQSDVRSTVCMRAVGVAYDKTLELLGA